MICSLSCKLHVLVSLDNISCFVAPIDPFANVEIKKIKVGDFNLNFEVALRDFLLGFVVVVVLRARFFDFRDFEETISSFSLSSTSSLSLLSSSLSLSSLSLSSLLLVLSSSKSEDSYVDELIAAIRMRNIRM